LATGTEHHVLGGHLTLSLVSPEGTLFEGPADLVVVPGHDGEVAFLPGHAPYVGLLGVGELRFRSPAGGTRRFFLTGGVVQVVENTVAVLSEGGISDLEKDPSRVFENLVRAMAQGGIPADEARRRFARFSAHVRDGGNAVPAHA
jgi:F-type H+-transporting ATPase subunit epsilon